MSTPALRKALRRAVAALSELDLNLYDQASEQLNEHDEGLEFGFYVLRAATESSEYRLDTLHKLGGEMNDRYGEILDVPAPVVSDVLLRLQDRSHGGAVAPRGDTRLLLDAVCGLLAAVCEGYDEDWSELLADAMDIVENEDGAVVKQVRVDEEPEIAIEGTESDE